MSKVYVGMDMGSKVTAVAARDESGESLERLTFKTSRDGIIAGVARYGFETVVMMEEGEMAGWAYRTLLPYVEQVIVCDPKRNAWISKGTGTYKSQSQGNISPCTTLWWFPFMYVSLWRTPRLSHVQEPILTRPEDTLDMPVLEVSRGHPVRL